MLVQKCLIIFEPACIWSFISINWLYNILLLSQSSGTTICRRCHEKTSYVLNYGFFTLLHKNGSIEGKHITLKNSNNTLLAMKSELHTEEFL